MEQKKTKIKDSHCEDKELPGKGNNELVVTVNITDKRPWVIPILSKFTILQGNSAEGKSTFMRTLEKLGTKITCDISVEFIRGYELKKYEVYPKKYLEVAIASLSFYDKPSVLCVDEDLLCLYTPKFQTAMLNSKHYFIIACRYPLMRIPYASYDIRRFKTVGQVDYAVSLYQDLYKVDWTQRIDAIKCEDAKSGLEFLRKLHPLVESCHGKDKIALSMHQNQYTLYLADGVGIGSSLPRILESLKVNRGNQILLIESFEAFLLESSFLNNRVTPHYTQINKEVFYTQTLMAFMKECGNHYNKSRCNPCFYENCCYKAETCGLLSPGNKLMLIVRGTPLEGLYWLGQQYRQRLTVSAASVTHAEALSDGVDESNSQIAPSTLEDTNVF